MSSSRRRSRIPHFRSEAEEAAFWDTHDTTDFLDELRPAKLTFARPRPKVLVSVRIAKSEVNLLRRLAQRRGLAFGSLIRMWVTDRLRDELHTAHR